MTPAHPPRNNLAGGAWLFADMALNIWALSIVKAIGGDYPASQIVFLRALTGLVLISPLVWRERRIFYRLSDLGIHLLRVALAVITLTSSFFAISRVPLAVFTTVNFTRPVITMVLAALVLRERIPWRNWCAAGLALMGVSFALSPDLGLWTPGMAALFLVALTGSATTIATRRLRQAPTLVMMAFYTGGLTLGTAPFALTAWRPVTPSHIAPLLLIGLFAQCAQACYLRAHYHGEAGFLSVLSYSSLVLSISVGYVVFGETLTRGFFIGAALVSCAALWVTLNSNRRPWNANQSQ